MLFKEKFIEGIRRGAIDVTFRRWQSPRVKPGGCYRIRPDVVVRVQSVTTTTLAVLTTGDAARAGFDSITALRAEIRGRGKLYRVTFAREAAAPDPRSVLAKEHLTDAAFADLERKLDDMDARTASGAWTRAALQLIDRHPGRRAGDLAPELDMDTATFKPRVRRLKALGLLSSLEVGYALTNRGAQYLARRRAR